MPTLRPLRQTGRDPHLTMESQNIGRAMEEVFLGSTHGKSKRSRSSTAKENPRERSRKSSSSSSPNQSSNSAASRKTRPSLTSRTASAPHVPSTKTPKVEIIGLNLDGHQPRDSIASIREDPFFKNYQTPHSVSLAKELRSATYTERLRDEGTLHAHAKMDESTNLPVCGRNPFLRVGHVV